MCRVLTLGKGLVQGKVIQEIQEKPLWAVEHDSEAKRYCSQCKLTPAALSLYTVVAGEDGSRFRITPACRASQRNHSKERAHQKPWG